MNLFKRPREYVSEWAEQVRDSVAEERLSDMEQKVQRIETDREVRQRYLEILRDSLKDD